jgi:hypothetical protein
MELRSETQYIETEKSTDLEMWLGFESRESYFCCSEFPIFEAASRKKNEEK